MGVALPLVAAGSLAVGCARAGGGPTPPDATPLPGAVATFDSAWGIIARTYWDTTYNGVD